MGKTLIIDGQLLQTSAWHRGMGKYTLQVMHQLSEAAPDDLAMAVVFNTNLERDTLRLETVRYLCPRIKQLQYDLPVPATERRADVYRTALETHINRDFPDGERQYLITSLFFFDFFAEFPADCRRLILFYDLTPFLFWRDLGGYFPPDLYMGRFQRILEADHLFAISETTRRDLLSSFGLPVHTVTNINGGFTRTAETTRKPRGLDIPARYILFPTGDLPHKNNEVAVKGYAKYQATHPGRVPLLITSNFSEATKQRLSLMADNIVFTGNISDEELEWLYEHAAAVLFASKYEGLGMPVLDAVASKEPVITSSISVFEEMSKQAFYYFDESDPQSLADALDRALEHTGFPRKLESYPDIMQKYTWQNTCDAILDVLMRSDKPDADQPVDAFRPRIAVACLHPGIAGQIGRLAERLHYTLDQDFTVDYYFDTNGYHYREMERPSFLDFFSNKPHDISDLDLGTYKKYEAVVYLVDNAAIPSRLAQRASVLPGIAITHPGRAEASRDVFKEIVMENQKVVEASSSPAGVSYAAIAGDIKEYVLAQRDHPDHAVRIIRQGGPYRDIIQKLLKVVGRQ
ncbi:MAG: glycosyltransferase family 1 protein [Candidatus Saccharibacteria bacterium]